jgi:hypothetical protein
MNIKLSYLSEISDNIEEYDIELDMIDIQEFINLLKQSHLENSNGNEFEFSSLEYEPITNKFIIILTPTD